MSRAERRAYKRMIKNQDPYALPGASATRARAERQRTRRPSKPAGDFTFVSRRFLVWAIGGGVAAGLIAFSIAWPNGMPFSLYIGLAATAAWLVLCWLVRAAQARAAAARAAAAR